MPEKTSRRKRRKSDEMPERRETYAVSVDEDVHRILGTLAERERSSRKAVVTRLVLDEARFEGVER